MSGGLSGTFFCKRTTLVHFFSSKPSYFLRVASSKAAGMLTSWRNASAVLGALMTPRYATMALWLSRSVRLERAGRHGGSQLFRLPVGQDRTHGKDVWRMRETGRAATMHEGAQ